MSLSLFKCISDKTDEKGNKYTDLYLGQVYESKLYLVRVKPCFTSDYKIMIAMAKPLDNIEDASKCM